MFDDVFILLRCINASYCIKVALFFHEVKQCLLVMFVAFVAFVAK